MIGALGTGVMAVPLFTSGAVSIEPAVGPASPTVGPAESVGNPTELIAPLGAGSKLARWTIVEVQPLLHGALTLIVRGEGEHTFAIEVLARDHGPLRIKPPAETQRFAVHVRNGGDGWQPTVEDQGLAAKTLAQIIAKNEATVDANGFLTHAERYARHAALRSHPSAAEAGSSRQA
jgi:hypothetical protein